MSRAPTTQPSEAAAERCLRACLGGRPLASAPLPIPVERWVESPLGIDLEIGDTGSDAHGLARPSQRQIIIDQSISDDDERFRFTLAHELGHIWMHAGVEHAGSAQPAVDAGPLEREADTFAAAFLIPLRLLLREVVTTAQRTGPGQGGALPPLLAGGNAARELWEGVLIPALRARFGVSRSAVLLRASGVKLADGAPLLLTSTLVGLQEARD